MTTFSLLEKLEAYRTGTSSHLYPLPTILSGLLASQTQKGKWKLPGSSKVLNNKKQEASRNGSEEKHLSYLPFRNINTTLIITYLWLALYILQHFDCHTFLKTLIMPVK